MKFDRINPVAATARQVKRGRINLQELAVGHVKILPDADTRCHRFGASEPVALGAGLGIGEPLMMGRHVVAESCPHQRISPIRLGQFDR